MKRRLKKPLINNDPPVVRTIRELRDALRFLNGWTGRRFINIGRQPELEAFDIIEARCLRHFGEVSQTIIGKLVGQISEDFGLKVFQVYSMTLTEFAAKLSESEPPKSGRVTVTDRDCPSANWPPDDKWCFRHGEAAFRRISFSIKGKQAKVLQFLARTRRGVTANEIGDDVSPGSAVQQATIRGYLSNVRKVLQSAFNITGDPIPKIDSGSETAWKLDCAVLTLRISSVGSDRKTAQRL